MHSLCKREVRIREEMHFLCTSVADPDPNPDPSISMFLGLPDPDPDPLVRGLDPYPDPSITKQN
jgi:hypothetical protein